MNFLNNLLNKKTEVKITEVREVEAPTISTVEPGDWFTSKEHYLEFRAAFKKYLREGGEPQACHFLLYAILRNRDWKKGWTYPEHPGKQVEHTAKLSQAFSNIKSTWMENYLLKPFDGTVTTEMLMALRENLEDYRK
jgi:hypothetical protein